MLTTRRSSLWLNVSGCDDIYGKRQRCPCWMIISCVTIDHYHKVYLVGGLLLAVFYAQRKSTSPIYYYIAYSQSLLSHYLFILRATCFFYFLDMQPISNSNDNKNIIRWSACMVSACIGSRMQTYCKPKLCKRIGGRRLLIHCLFDWCKTAFLFF